MMEFCERHRGSITVFLTFLVLPIMLFAGLMIDFTRLYGARTVLKGAEDLALNSCLAGFNTELQSRYGLFAVTTDSSTLKNSVKSYFEQTINSTNLLSDNEDAYTQKLIEYLKGKLDKEEESYDNLLNLELEDFELNSVEGSQLLYPEALKSQIVEYMKYRGPVSLGYGFMDKLNFLASVPKQSAAIKKETAYEQKLDDLQDVCMDAYNACQNLINAQTEWNVNLSDINEVQSSLEADSREAVQYLVLGYMNDNITPILGGFDAIPESGSLTDKEAAYQKIKALSEETDTRWIDTVTILDRIAADCPSGLPSIDQLQRVNTYFSTYKQFKNEIIGEIKKYYRLAKAYVDEMDDTETEEAEETKDDDDDTEETSGTKVDWTPIENWYQNEFKTKVNTYAEIASRDYQAMAHDRINELLHPKAVVIANRELSAKRIAEYAKTASRKLKELANEASSADKAKSEWKNAIDNLDDGEVKTSMNNNYSTQAKNMDVDKINHLKSLVDEIEKYYSDLKDKLEKISSVNTKLYESASIDFADSWKNQLKGSVSASWSYSQRVDFANTYDLKIVLSDFTSIEGNNHDITSNEVYQYLKNLSKTSEVTDTVKKDEVKSKRKEVIEEGNKTSSKTADLSKSDSSSDTPSLPSGITSIAADIYNALPSHSTKTGVATSDGKKNEQTMSTKDDTDEMADSAKKLLGESDSFLASLPDIISKIKSGGELVRDDLYVMEYAMNMFSYYNITSEATTYAGDKMSADTNELYRSEIEYLIWGDENAQDNIDKTMGMIFAIRYVLNTMYAFSDSEIQEYTLSLATALVGWTGFGIPIVKTVLILAISLAETAWDMEDLKKTEKKDGTAAKEVPLFKSSKTWRLKPSNLLTTGLDKLKESTIDKVENLTQKLNNLTTEKAEEFRTALDQQMAANKTAIKNQVKNAITVPIQNMLTAQVTAMDDIDTDEYLDVIFNQIRADSSDGTIVSQAKVAVLDTISPLIKHEVKEQYNILRAKIKSNTINPEDISEQVENCINVVMDAIERKLNADKLIDQFFDTTTTKIKDLVNAGGDKVQSAVSKAFDDMAEQLGGGSVDSTTGAITANQGETTAKTLTMSYRDYLKVFLIINYYTGNDNGNNKVVKRIADLVQLNVSKTNDSFTMDKAYTMFQVKDSTTIHMIFMWMPFFNNGTADEDKKKYILKSTLVRGY